MTNFDEYLVGLEVLLLNDGSLLDHNGSSHFLKDGNLLGCWNREIGVGHDGLSSGTGWDWRGFIDELIWC